MSNIEDDFTQPIYFRNEQWAVTGYGIECTGALGGYPYEIEALTLGDSWDAKLPDWPRHMQDKEWVRIDLFLPAFIIALTIHSKRFKPRFPAHWYEATARDLDRRARRNARSEAMEGDRSFTARPEQ